MQTISATAHFYTPSNSNSTLAAIAGGIIFQALFWQEKMGINLVLFFTFIIVSLFVIYRTALSIKNCFWLLCAVLISLAAVVVHNTLLSKIAFILSLLVFVVCSTNFYRSLHYCIAGIVQRILNAIPLFTKDWLSMTQRKNSANLKKHNYRLLILPLMLTTLFTGIYLLASYVLADIASHIGDWVGHWLGNLINWICIPRLFFLVPGIFISATLLINHQSCLPAKEKGEQNDLLRVHIVKQKKGFWRDIQLFLFGKNYDSMLALRLEYKGAIISLLLLNLLLMLVNATDIIYVWFNRIYKAGFEWADFVHNGAEILVFSILLAMAVLLYFFRGNINFLQQNKTLKTIACLWIFQNLVLTISVGIRNYYYVAHMGLAYKRIGLFVFVILVAVGLITIYIKISKQKTFYYLLRTNGWIAYMLFILCATVHWDEAIVRYNLSKKDEIPLDVLFLLRLSDKSLPILDQYSTFLASPQTALQKHYYDEYTTGFPIGQLQWRKQHFKKEYNSRTWLSWNYADSYINEYLRKQPK